MIKLLMMLPNWLLLILAGKKQIEIDGRKLHIPFQYLLKLSGNPFENLNDVSPDDFRKGFIAQSELSSSATPSVEWKDHEVEVPQGKIRVREYYSPSISSNAGLMFYHGGGFVIGNIETHHDLTTYLCNKLESKVFSVEYRLSPENKFPIPLDDSFKAYEWAVASSEKLGIDPGKISVAGDSCGGNIAASVCIRSRKEVVQCPKAQLLLYPWTDLEMKSDSIESLNEGFSLTKPILEWFRKHYLNDLSEASLATASPLLEEDLTNLPPAHICTAGFDPLRDEGKKYSEKLLEAGNQVTYKEYSGFIHLFANMQFIPGVKESIDEICEGFKQIMN